VHSLKFLVAPQAVAGDSDVSVAAAAVAAAMALAQLRDWQDWLPTRD
jgi:hypothetical protein